MCGSFVERFSGHTPQKTHAISGNWGSGSDTEGDLSAHEEDVGMTIQKEALKVGAVLTWGQEKPVFSKVIHMTETQVVLESVSGKLGVYPMRTVLELCSLHKRPLVVYAAVGLETGMIHAASASKEVVEAATVKHRRVKIVPFVEATVDDQVLFGPF